MPAGTLDKKGRVCIPARYRQILAAQDTSGVIVRKSNWFIKSKTYGQIAVGQNGTATYHLLDDADL